VLDSSNHNIEERMKSLLPQEAQQQAINFLPNTDFEVAYRLDCRNLCADFREDIQFHFSLGITSLMRRFLGPKGTKAILMGYSDTIPRPIPSTPQTPSNESFPPSSEESEALMAVLGSFSSLYSRSTVGALAITGLIAKAAGWRVIAICGAIYGLLYVYERLTWTNKAKERTFKKQYVDYASSKLRLIVDLTSSNCSHQVQQELTSTFARLCRHVDLAKDELQSDMERLQVDITKLEEVSSRCSFLKNKAGYLDTELNTFIKQYLKPDSQL
jgi:mitofusin